MRIPISLVITGALSACTLGPDYSGPPTVGSSGSTPRSFARSTPAIAEVSPMLDHWWTSLGDPTLDELERRAIASNPTIAIAQARLRTARGAVRLERANSLPSAGPSATYIRAELPSGTLGSSDDGGGQRDSLNIYNLGFDASWEIDLFGGQRRTIEAARAGVGAAQANVADAQVSLTAEVARAYVYFRNSEQQIVLARDAAAVQRQMLALIEQRYRRGASSDLDVERQRKEAETAEAQILPLAADRDAYRNALAVLTGAEPGAVDASLSAPGRVPLPPAKVAIGDPTALLQRRPDIRAAERQLAATTARIGVAEAARFPRISFQGLIGLGGSNPSDVADLDNLIALAAPSLSWNVLDFGRGAARVEQAKGSRDEADAAYRQTVLAALRDAEDALGRFGNGRQNLSILARARTAADRAASMMRQRYDAGTVRLIDVLDTERQRVAAEQSLATATADFTGDYVALQKALGLGWQAAGPSGLQFVPIFKPSPSADEARPNR
jgi:NodT family efflux transporter outer membrane factor (OMF) lipoprotein